MISSCSLSVLMNLLSSNFFFPSRFSSEIVVERETPKNSKTRENNCERDGKSWGEHRERREQEAEHDYRQPANDRTEAEACRREVPSGQRGGEAEISGESQLVCVALSIKCTKDFQSNLIENINNKPFDLWMDCSNNRKCVKWQTLGICPIKSHELIKFLIDCNQTN